MFNVFCLALFYLTFASVGVSYTPIFDLQVRARSRRGLAI